MLWAWISTSGSLTAPSPSAIRYASPGGRCTASSVCYLWLTYRTFALRDPLRLSWRQVYRQFGLHPAKANDKRTVLDFRRKVLRELKKIKLAWPELNYSTAPGVLILHPSTPAIPPASEHPALVS